MAGITKLELRTALGPVYRDVLPNPPRDCTADEIPVIDLAPMFSKELSDRKSVAGALKAAATNNGFFYIKNHGIPEETIAKCKQQVLNFMRQPQEKKDLLESRTHSKYYNGYLGNRKAQISRTETADVRESFSFRYSPELDPDHPMDISEVSPEVRSWIRGEDFVVSRFETFRGLLRLTSDMLTLDDSGKAQLICQTSRRIVLHTGVVVSPSLEN